MSLPSLSSRAAQLPFAAQAPKLPQSASMIGGSAKAAGLSEAGQDPNNDDVRKVAESFEAIILRQLLGSMRKAKLSEDMFGSSATDNFREMADARTADSMAGMRQFGIADMVEQQLRGVGGAK